ncbi:hypothetical protein H6F61_20485 [Cyanobacteria bacterium FACHB-472]|nr:hypothetical protein [Cyanobacteria bacterium FACHB-472]
MTVCAAYTACGIGGTDLRGGGVEGCDREVLLLTADRVSAAFWKAIANLDSVNYSRFAP